MHTGFHTYIISNIVRNFVKYKLNLRKLKDSIIDGCRSLIAKIFLGACEGTLSCSTCHIIFKKEDFDKLPDKPSDEEMDMLDLAYGLTDT